MEWKGQKLVEQMMQILLTVFAAAALAVGYALGSFQTMMLIYASGVVITSFITIPDWPFLSRHPLKWVLTSLPFPLKTESVVLDASHYKKPSCFFGGKRSNCLSLGLLQKQAFQSWSLSISPYWYRYLLFLITFSMMPVVVLGEPHESKTSHYESLEVLYVFLGIVVAIFGSLGIYLLWKKYSQRPRLVSSNVFDTYPIHVFVGSSQVIECFICTEAYILGDIICTIPCGHAFHVHHIREWLTKRAPTCPTCRISHT